MNRIKLILSALTAALLAMTVGAGAAPAGGFTPQRLEAGEWKTIGKAKATPPKPLNFWPVFKRMGVGTYRIVARAHNGAGEERQESPAKTIRFKVVTHIAHRD